MGAINISNDVFVLLYFLLCMMNTISQDWEKKSYRYAFGTVLWCTVDICFICALLHTYIHYTYVHTNNMYIHMYILATVHSAWANIKQARNNCSICAAHFMISLSSCDSQIKIIGLRRNYASAQQQISHMCMTACACECVLWECACMQVTITTTTTGRFPFSELCVRASSPK